ncbi:MAG: DUF1934 domain-containing protein [Clostridia bacterium]
MLKEDFCITVIGKQKYDNEEENEIKLDVLGSYSIKNGHKIIAYKEHDEETDTKGRTTILKIENDNILTMTKTGSETKLILEKNKKHSCFYDTAFGSMQMDTFTNVFKNNLTDEGGFLEVNYVLDINSAYASENNLYIKIKSKNKGMI